MTKSFPFFLPRKSKLPRCSEFSEVRTTSHCGHSSSTPQRNWKVPCIYNVVLSRSRLVIPCARRLAASGTLVTLWCTSGTMGTVCPSWPSASTLPVKVYSRGAFTPYVWFVDCFEREAKGRCDEILCLDIGVLGQNVVRFLHADAGRFGCLPQANEADDCGVFVEVVCVAGDVPLGVEVYQVEEVHARVADVVLAFQRSAKSPRRVMLLSPSLVWKWNGTSKKMKMVRPSSVLRDSAARAASFRGVRDMCTAAIGAGGRVLDELSESVEGVDAVEDEDEPDGFAERGVASSLATSTTLPLNLEPKNVTVRQFPLLTPCRPRWRARSVRPLCRH